MNSLHLSPFRVVLEPSICCTKFQYLKYSIVHLVDHHWNCFTTLRFRFNAINCKEVILNCVTKMTVGGTDGNEVSLEQTPTWAVAVVCSVFVIISLLMEQAIHHVGTVRFCQLLLFIFISIFRFQPILVLIVFGFALKNI